MDASTEAERGERVAEVLALAATRLSAAEYKRVEPYAREFFRRADPDDLAERKAEDLLGAVLSQWQFAAVRTPGAPKVRVFSPSVGEDGWGSRHTVVQVVNDDMPFLVDSVTMEANRQGHTLHLMLHPIYAVQRDGEGRLQTVALRDDAPDAPRESWMYLEVDRLVDAQQRAALAAGIERVLADVRAAVTDWKAMRERLQAVITELDNAPSGLPVETVAETRAFLQWLADDHLTMLGYRCHDLIDQGGQTALRVVPGSGLGLLRMQPDEALSASFAALQPQVRALARAPLPIVVVTKANTRSTVHRDGYTDYIGIKRYDASGAVVGEHRFIGLFTSTAYQARVSETPLLRGKVEAIAKRAGLAPGGHAAKALQHILETYPRDDLFQIPDNALYETALGILALGERHRLRVFMWHDPFERFVSCLVFVPREAFSTDLRVKFRNILMQAFHGTQADFDVLLSGTTLARIHFTIRTTPGQIPAVDRKELEHRLEEAARRWDDDLRKALVDAEGEAGGLALFKRWGSAFPAAYRDRVGARAAVPDVRRIAGLTPEKPLAVALYWPLGAPTGTLGLKVYRLGDPIVLSDSLPMLEHMGVRVMAEANYRIEAFGNSVSMHDFELQAQPAAEIEPETLARLFEDAFARVFRGEVESDSFNRLVLLAGLAAEEIVVLRAYTKYLKQIGFAQSQATIAATLAAHPRIARMLVLLFKLRFDPKAHDEAGAQAQVNAIEKALEKVSNLSEDRVLRQMLALVQATLRTNYWRTGTGHSGAAGPRRSFLSMKFDSASVPGLPQPRPLYEIFVYSPRFEGIHLRGGKVARGGLRWSDRPDDFRTEVLGLVKAQMVKNTVIVPVGSKGGFVLKKAPPPSDRDAWMKEGIACYQDYLRGLLDLTDNLIGGKAVPPPHVVRADGDDPYLVVAADKGTATFSDFANQVSAEYGHWLGDAFASGGSVGYDHKAMGITARGAWESVKRHFREMGVDTQTTDFTVVGVGDMSGDVFGNGMLLSKHIRLVAAFDHRHIFIDPTPEAASSFAERERLFKLPRSSWADYDTQLISAGGGVWARSEKSVPLSPQARSALGITAESLTPSELVTAILKAPVDLLYNGGIGTYVKASTESHAEVGDRANDGVRIDGKDLRVKVVAEGGNLGLTQRGRIEAAQAGVRLNTDAIDNSAGVDTSDHEVNIKILLGIAVGDGEMTEKQRNALLPQMTDEVAALVLRDNYFQTQALSIGKRLAVKQLDEQARFMRFLEKKGELHRAIEYLPTEDEIAERKARGQGLTAPEQAVLLAYSKMWLNDELIASDLVEDPWVATALERYFPRVLKEKFAAYIPRHPLKREIIATHVLNSMINRVGPTFVHRLSEITGTTAPQIVRAYLATREVFGFVKTWQEIEALDNVVPDAVQAEMVIELRGLIARATTWFLRSRRLYEPTEQQVKRFTPAVQALRERLETQSGISPRAAAWIQAGVPQALALHVDAAAGVFDALDIAEISDTTKRPLQEVAAVHAGVGQRLGLNRLRGQIEVLPAESYWQGLAKLALGDDLADLQRSIALEAVSHHEGDSATILDGWEHDNRQALERAQRLLAETSETGGDLAMLSVALRELRNLV
ncbi:NAD-glutamate dehydrogenase [Ramlibacter albus]|uniref:NAD-glutamate dehydrogenase n=1 Tax=Ramlibacter albus TaxID=2079448 RepID=A0A923S0T7_9BURK|nr:NAD-glutamate dehydrogenase domain-containing protein [Ramlibacter albus]MBC5763714.1 NAD-glutamate dehydrogenase [Ramlibacter albus]